VAGERIITKATRIAAHLLGTEAEEEEVVQVPGGFAVEGSPERKLTWRQIATAAYDASKLPGDMELGLHETSYYDPRRESWGFGAHVCSLKIDRDTGNPTIDTLVLVDDCGVIINPMIVEGQIHGGLAQGLGEAFREQMLFDPDGTVLTGSLMDYAVPRAVDMPNLILGETITPNPNNPLGVKGVGEAGTNGAPPAIANALMDALAPLGITHIDMPYTAPKLWEAIRQAGG
jgi:carbon-monoxide dehydrogenase large subunit